MEVTLSNKPMFIKMFDWQDVIVETESGYLQGTFQQNSKGPDFFSFKGIPYAEPPVGALRFEDPVPVKKWSGVRMATEYGSMCTQYNSTMRVLAGSENCLFLNIWTRSVENIKVLKPVMVWIHGGGFMIGSGDDMYYGPEYLMRKDIVLVTINYRLGVLGFLNLEDEVMSGNQALKDQILALKWIKKNIENFGGNPNNVTIFGESAGAISAHFLALSPMAKGLFHKVILQSGCAINCWGSVKNPRKNVLKLTSILGKELKDSKEIVEFLKTIPSKKLVEAQETIKKDVRLYCARCHFGPGEDSASLNPVMPMSIEKAAEQGVHLPLLIGHNSGEGIGFMIRYSKDIFPYADQNFDKILSYDVEDVLKKKYNLTLEKLRYLYFKNDRISYNNRDTFVNMLGEVYLIEGIHDTIKVQTEKSSSPTYFYQFSYEENMTIAKTVLKYPLTGASHFDEIEYLFYIDLRTQMGLNPIRKGSESYKLMERMTEMWTNFATHGSPIPATSDLLPVQWLPVDNATSLCYLNIDKRLQMKSVPNIQQKLLFKHKN